MGSTVPSVKYLVTCQYVVMVTELGHYAPVDPIGNVQRPICPQRSQVMCRDSFRLARALEHEELRENGGKERRQRGWRSKRLSLNFGPRVGCGWYDEPRGNDETLARNSSIAACHVEFREFAAMKFPRASTSASGER